MSLALMMPASAAAAGGFSYTILKNHCTNYPAVVFKVSVTAAGSTNANKLTINSKGQTGSPGHWTTYQTWPRVTSKFVNDGTSHSLAVKRTYLGDAFARNRIVFKLRAWHGRTLLWSAKVISKTC